MTGQFVVPGAMEEQQRKRRDDCVMWIQNTGEGLVQELKACSKQWKDRRQCTIFRVPKVVMSHLGPEEATFYTPEGISLGLFHKPGRYVHAPTRGEKFKQKMAIAFLASKALQSPNSSPPFASYFSGSNSNSQARADQSVLPDELWAALHKVLSDPSKYKVYYDLDEDDLINGDSEDVLQKALTRALTLDGIVVGCLFWWLSYNHAVPRKKFPFPAIKDCAKGGIFSGIPTEDFLKLENQIPLKLAEEVLLVLNRDNGELNSACAQFATYYVEYLPGYDSASDLKFIDHLKELRKFLGCDHLLDCVAVVLREPQQSDREGQSRSPKVWPIEISRFILKSFGKIWSWRVHHSGNVRRWTPRWCFKRGNACSATSSISQNEESSTFYIPCATILREAGIKLRGCKRGPKSDLLPVFKTGWFTATLEIPRLPVLPNVTWTLWRNILVYEYERNRHCEESYRKQSNREESQMHAFLALMGCLIDTKDDVVLFRIGADPILPYGYQCSPEVLVDRFNNILKGLPFADYSRWVVLANQINNYCRQKSRKRILGLFRANFGKPWLAASAVAATLLLLLSLTQTMYTVWTFYKQYP